MVTNVVRAASDASAASAVENAVLLQSTVPSFGRRRNGVRPAAASPSGAATRIPSTIASPSPIKA